MAEKEWRPFGDECKWCGDEAQVLTDSGRDNVAYDGDAARCEDCGCPGIARVDEDGLGWIEWHDEPNCQCDWCKANPVT